MELKAQRPELKKMLVEASQALALLDADQLEEMAASCEALISPPGGAAGQFAAQCVDIRQELSTFKRVMEATRANMSILCNLDGGKPEQLEYTPMTAIARANPRGGNGDY